MTPNKIIQVNLTTEEKKTIGDTMDILKKIYVMTEGYVINKDIDEAFIVLCKLYREEILN